MSYQQGYCDYSKGSDNIAEVWAIFLYNKNNWYYWLSVQREGRKLFIFPYDKYQGPLNYDSPATRSQKHRLIRLLLTKNIENPSVAYAKPKKGQFSLSP
jgi:hypothetical protein